MKPVPACILNTGKLFFFFLLGMTLVLYCNGFHTSAGFLTPSFTWGLSFLSLKKWVGQKTRVVAGLE